jgi:putative peptidoglycan lipid II flippase
MGLLKSTFVVSIFTFLSRITGFIRDMITASMFGAGQWTDAFFVVFKIPNFFRRIFAEGSFSLAFVPVLNDIKATQSKTELKTFINNVAGSFLSVLIIVWMLLEIFAPQILSIFDWPSESPEVYSESIEMFRWTLFYLPTISLVAFFGGILNAHKNFVIPAATPILLNISLITSALFLNDYFDIPIKSLAFGVLVAGFAQLLFQVPSLIRLGMFPRFTINFKDYEVKKVMKLMVPSLFGSSIAQINLLFDTLLATFLPIAGSVTFLYYSDRLLEFPLGVFAIAISTVILPTLSRQFATNNIKNFQDTLRWALNIGVFIAMPAAAGLIVLARQVVITLFEHGEFNLISSELTALSLMAYMLALPAYIINKILLPAFYSRKNTKTPVKIGVIALSANMLFNVFFVASLWYFDFKALHVGLALASALSGWLQTFLLFRSLKSENIIQTNFVDWNKVIKILIATFIMSLSLVLLLNYLGNWHVMLWYQRVFNMLLCVFIGFSIYLIALLILKLQIKQMLHLE